MGEISEMMQEGILCQYCGVLMDDLIPEEGNELKDPPMHPRSCEGCEE